MYEPDDILTETAETYRQKNADYGNSWELTGETLDLWSGGKPVVLETAEDHKSFGLFTRELDKFIRAFHLAFCSDGERNFESLYDSHADRAGYAAMHASLHADNSVTYEVAADGGDIDADDPDYRQPGGPAVPDEATFDQLDESVDAEYERFFQSIVEAYE